VNWSDWSLPYTALHGCQAGATRGPVQAEALGQLLVGELLPWFEIAADVGPLDPVVRSFSQWALAGGSLITEIGDFVGPNLLAALRLLGRRQAI
jgi:hypothetical protein